MLYQSAFKNRIIWWLVPVAILLVLFGVLACGQVVDQQTEPQAVEGVLDLRDWDFEQNGIVSLNGEWEFYWEQLLVAEDFSTNPPPFTGFIHVPDSWNGYMVDGMPLTGDGYATYRLRVLLNDGLPQTTLRLFAVDTPLPIPTAHKFYVDGVLVGSDGVVGPSIETMTPQYTPYVTTFAAEANELEIIVQVSNFYTYEGGIFQPVYFGPQNQVYAARQRRLNITLFLVGSILMMGLYHLGLFGLRRQDKSSLYFGLFCLTIAARAFITEYPQILGNNWLFFTQTVFILIYATVVLVVLFTKTLFPQEFSKRVLYLILGVTTILALIVLFAPPKIYTFLLPTAVYAVSTNLYVVYVVAIAVVHRQEGARIFLFGYVMAFLAILHDALLITGVIQSTQIVPLGIFVLIISQAYLLSRRSAHNFSQVEELSTNLQLKVEERTQELTEKNIALQETQAIAEEAQQEAEKANQAKSTFLANMSHELRTPLNAILGFSQLMTRDKQLTTTQQENLHIITNSGEHLLTLINQVLDLSKIEAGQISLNSTIFNLHQLLIELEGMFRLRAEDKNLRLTFEIQPDVPRHVYTDEMKLRQVLINLLNNALKFTKDGGVILLVEVRGQELAPLIPGPQSLTPNSSLTPISFTVSDTGPGIAPQEMDKLFKAFSQTETGRQAQEGTGLGLNISHKLVQLLGGELTATSPTEVNHMASENGSNPDPGTAFSFTIPVTLQADSLIKEQAQDTPLLAEIGVTVIGLEPGQPRYRILIVDDNQYNRQVLHQLLTEVSSPQTGFEIEEAENGQQAIDIWQEFQPHLIWMDIRMPVMDGYAATRQIKEKFKTQNPEFNTIIIALTASSFNEEIAPILAAGCDDFLRKPFKETDIFRLMSKHLGLKFIYSKPPGTVAEIEPNILSKTLPANLILQLTEAVEIGDMQAIEQTIKEISIHNYNLATTLQNLANNFEYDQILQLLTQE